MKISLLVGITLFGSVYAVRAQSCLDSIRIKCYVITPVRGSNYAMVRDGKQKRMTNIFFSDHTFYKYHLPLDSIDGVRDLKYWLINYKLLKKNNFSSSDHWLTERRTLDSCNEVIKLSPWKNFGYEAPFRKIEMPEFNNEVAFKVSYLDGIWNKIKVNLLKNGEFLNAEPYLDIKPSDTVLDLFILRKVLSVDESLDSTNLLNDRR
jgi:hypothetical protein